MPATDRFLTSTRGRILTRLLREPRTVADLAAEVGISVNAARTHVNGLERDGYVERFRLKHTASKPAAMYRATPEGEALFPKAYEPVLQALMDEIEEEYGEDAVGVLQNVGARMARKHAGRRTSADPTTDERIDIALDLLTELGAVLEVEHLSGGVVRVEGSGCPLSGAVREHPELCGMIAAMLEKIIFLPVEQCCRNDGERPSCRFVIGAMPAA